MQVFALAAASLAAAAVGLSFPRSAFADPEPRISGPHVHENLAVYFIHGDSKPGPVPLTLKEALDKGSVRVIETGNVNELKVENLGEEEVFIQAGDIVKGGKQDRVLSLSLVLPARSGEVDLAAFCVEQGRWSARGGESVAAFSSAAEAMPSREARVAMAMRPARAEPAAAPNPGRLSPSAPDPQQQVWASVAATQDRLSASLGAPVAAAHSTTSLQLSLENEQLQKARSAYIEALQDADAADDVIGYILAINGRIVSADAYPSNGLFRKMWDKQLAAGVTEAIGAAAAPRQPTPDAAAAGSFLREAASAAASPEQVVNNFARREVHEAEKALYVEARRGDGSWVHRNYLAK